MRRQKSLWARAVRFGRLDRAAGRVDHERAEGAIAAVVTGKRPRVRWARGLVEGAGLAAGCANDRLSVTLGSDEWSGSLAIRSRARADRNRIARVARFDDLLVMAARRASALQVPAGRRLAYRMSLPAPTVVSSVALSALNGRVHTRNDRVLGFASELSKASVLAVWFLDDGRVIAVPRPDLTITEGRLHAIERPAARWHGESLWFWDEIWIPDHLASRRHELGLADVLAERNLERRRVLVDMIGFENLARDASGGEPAQQDDYGRLWRLGRLLDDEDYVAVEVTNSTSEPDGSHRRYFLRVPPGTKTAREGVAWTFDMSVREYTLCAES